MKKILLNIIYYLAGLFFVCGIINHKLNIYPNVQNELIIALSIVIPLIADYDRIVKKGFVNLWLKLFIIFSAFIVLANFQLGLSLYLISASILFAKDGGLILKKY